ncbi:complement C3-like, partial [Tropilaelaps mercedesae]
MMSQDFHNASQSMFSFEYNFPEDPELGEWQVQVQYGNELRQKQTTSFELVEYVLPTFQVDIDVADTLVPPIEFLPVKVTATHVYGKPVQGQVMVKVFLKTAIGEPQQQGFTNWTKLDDNGEAVVYVNLAKYQGTDGWRAGLTGKRLLLEAEVLEHVSGKKERASTDRSIFEKYWYKVSTKLMQKSIRPGYPALITIRVQHANGAVAKDVPVLIKAFNHDERKIDGTARLSRRTDSRGMASFIVPTEPSYTQIRVEFEVGPFGKSTPARATFRAHREREFVALKKSPPEEQFEVGQTFPVEMNFQPENAFRGGFVAIIASGRVLQVKSVSINNPQVLSFTVTPEMSPLARVVAVGWTRDGAVSIDSYMMLTQPNCRHADYEVECTVHPTPGGYGSVEVSGAEKGTLVGLSLVDEAVYAVKNRAALTKKVIFEKLMEADRGCADGGGIDLQESAVAAGLVVITDQMMTSDAQNCKAELEKRRTRRSAQLNRLRDDKFAQ